MLEMGTFHLNFRLPDPFRFKVAALKHAYLAACLHLQRIPQTAEASTIRSDLLAVRDADKGAPFPRSGHAERLSLYRSHRPPQGPPLAIVVTRQEDDTSPREHLISLAGTVFVTWPFSENP